MSEEFVAEIDPDVIFESTCKALGLHPKRVKSPRRLPSLTEARFITVNLMRKHTDMSYPQIARYLEKKHHSCILNAMNQFEALHFSCPAFRVKVDKVITLLREKGYDC